MEQALAVLSAMANGAEIATAIVAVLFFGAQLKNQYNRRMLLDVHLKCGPWQSDGRPARKTVAQLSTELWMTPDQIFEAARGNRQLERGLDGGVGGVEDRLWLRYLKSN